MESIRHLPHDESEVFPLGLLHSELPARYHNAFDCDLVMEMTVD